MTYWINTRRALLREKIERCGLGGYLSLTNNFPGFLDTMDKILEEFRTISVLHDKGAPYSLKPRIAILHAWGKLRTWTLSGHFHETPDYVLIHVLESLSGLPFDVDFISFDDIKKGVPENIDVIINAGAEGDAWSGGELWNDITVIDNLTKWVHDGGSFLGIGEPSACAGGDRLLRMSHVLGVDIDNGEYTRHGRWTFDVSEHPGLIPDGVELCGNKNVMLTDGTAKVHAVWRDIPAITSHEFGKGTGIFCASFRHTPLSPRLLQNLILLASSETMLPECITDDALVEAAYYPNTGKLALINNSNLSRVTSCMVGGKEFTAELKPFELMVLDVG